MKDTWLRLEGWHIDSWDLPGYVSQMIETDGQTEGWYVTTESVNLVPLTVEHEKQHRPLFETKGWLIVKMVVFQDSKHSIETENWVWMLTLKETDGRDWDWELRLKVEHE